MNKKKNNKKKMTHLIDMPRGLSYKTLFSHPRRERSEVYWKYKRQEYWHQRRMKIVKNLILIALVVFWLTYYAVQYQPFWLGFTPGIWLENSIDSIPLGWWVAALLAPSYPFVFLGLRVSVRFVYDLIFDKIDDYFDERDERLERRMKNYQDYTYRESYERLRQQRQQPTVVAMNFTDSAMSGDINLNFND